MKRLVLGLFVLAACGGDDDGAGRADAEPETPDASVDATPPIPDPCEDAEPGIACTWLGIGGEEGFTPDGQNRFNTRIYWVMNVHFASDGTVYFDDWNNHLIRRIDEDGMVSTVIGWTDPVFPGDGVVGNPNAERVGDGAPGDEVQLNHPTDLDEDEDGNILIMAWHNHKLRVLDPETGLVRILAGAGAGFAGDGMAATAGRFRQPRALTHDEDGNLYITDQQNQRVRKITEWGTGTISTVAGGGMAGAAGGYGGDGNTATDASVLLNWEVGSNPEPSGGVAVADGKLYIADTLNNRIRVVDFESGLIDTLAGTGVEGNTGDDGPAAEATLAKPRDLEIGPDGDLYIADTDNNVIRAIDLDDVDFTIRRVAGTGDIGMGEGLPALETDLRRPFGIEFDADGNLYIMDSLNSRVLKVVTE